MSINEQEHAWEYHKENTAPLERGRNANTLHSKTNHLLSPTTQMQHESEIAHFEKLVSPSEHEDFSRKDPECSSDILIHWLSYIKFMQDTYPASTQPIFLLLERCTRALLQVSRYRNDTRFIRVCILYADKTSYPSDVYKFLHQSKVGTETALFWVAWAWVAEKSEDFKLCEKIFLKGLAKKAKPIQMLEKRYKQFQRRMCRHMLNRNEHQDEMELDENGRPLRGSLQQLSATDTLYNHRSRRFGDGRNDSGHGRPGFRLNQQQQQRISDHQQTFTAREPSSNHTSSRNNSQSGTGFSIFVESDENGGDYNLDQENYPNIQKRKLAKESDRMKENVGRTERWNESGGLQSSHQRSNHRSPQSSRRPPLQSAPKFEVFVDETCTDEKKIENEVDSVETTLRPNALKQRSKAGAVDKLVQDPLRYVRNPQKVQADQNQESKFRENKKLPDETKNSNKDENKKEARSSYGFDKKLVGKGEDGQETCFEEHRAAMRVYKIASAQHNFNLLKSKDVNYCGSPMSVDMEDASLGESVEMDCEDSNKNLIKDSKRKLEQMQPHRSQENKYMQVPPPRRLLKDLSVKDNFHDVTNAEENAVNLSAVSNASSTINERDAVGFIGEKEEATVNTKFAMRELSMMFSSPGGARTEANKKPLFSVFHENRGVFDGIEEEGADCVESAGNVEINNSILNGRGALANDDHFKGESKANKKLPFSIHIDEQEESGNDKGYKVKLNNQSNLQIYEDEGASYQRNTANNNDENRLGFQIYQDEEDSVQKDGVDEHDDGDTATFSIFNDIAASLSPIPGNSNQENKSSIKKFSIYDDQIASGDVSTGNISVNERSAAPFSIFSDPVATPGTPPSPILDLKLGKDKSTNVKFASDGNDTVDVDGDTATFSIFNDVLQDTNGACNSEDSAPSNEHNNRQKASTEKFSIFCDDDMTDLSRKMEVAAKTDFRKKNILTENQNFGDISRIDKGETTHFSIHKDPNPSNTPLPSTTRSDTPSASGAIDYRRYHNEKVRTALHEVIEKGSRKKSYNTPINSCEFIEDKRGVAIPKGFRLKSPSKPQNFTIGKFTANIIHELGHGAYGVVMLCKTSGIENTQMPRTDEQFMALKIQCPTGSLAWEFSILTKLKERLRHNLDLETSTNHCGKSYSKQENGGSDFDSQTIFPFPRAFSFSAYSNGGILGMTAGSHSGLNLVDIVNVHKVSGGGPVPELLAIHYTSRMLLYMEYLHWHGKILHCDVKPDNWVLIASKDTCGARSKTSIEGSDLMLVDFGRAIDLQSVTTESIDPLNLKFYGDISAEDMSCVAMRNNKGWGTDVDTYGLCASAHVLLYGSYMDIDQDAKGRWRPKKAIRRYWQKELWTELFGTLLNVKCGNNVNSGSHPNSLRAIRKSFEAYLNGGTRRKAVASLLHYQAGLLPKKRK